MITGKEFGEFVAQAAGSAGDKGSLSGRSVALACCGLESIGFIES
jgi:hypothetical protein